MGRFLTTAGPDTALVISGGRRDATILVGGRAFTFPGLMRCDRLSLELRAITVESSSSMTSLGVAVTVTGVCQVKVSGYREEEGKLVRDINAIRLAAQHFLRRKDAEIEQSIRMTLEGHQRAILGTLTVEEVYKDRQAFSDRVREVAASDVRNMGLEIVSYTLSSITDSEGYLDALGVAQTAIAKRDAEIGRAKGHAEAAIQAAQHDLSAAIQINEAIKKKEESGRDVKLAKSKYEEQTSKADEQAKAARLLEEALLRQDIVTMTERQKVKEAEEQLKVAQVTVDREKIRLEKTAEATGNAEVTRTTKQAEAIRLNAGAEAARIVSVGEAEAIALKKKYEVELEMLEGRAAAYKQYGNAAIAIQALEILPKVADAMASPLSQTEKMIFIGGGGDGGSGPSSFMTDISKGIGTVSETVNAMTGININRMLQNYTMQMNPPSSTKNGTVSKEASLPRQASRPRQASVPIEQQP